MLTLLSLGCYAAPPPPAAPAELSGCHPGAYGALSDFRCETDTDCLLCGPDECELTTRQQLQLTNAPCPPPDDEHCLDARAACCEGRCVTSLGPPRF